MRIYRYETDKKLRKKQMCDHDHTVMHNYSTTLLQNMDIWILLHCYSVNEKLLAREDIMHKFKGCGLAFSISLITATTDG